MLLGNDSNVARDKRECIHNEIQVRLEGRLSFARAPN